MTSDPIADMLTRIKNGYMAKKKEVVIPHSNVKEALAKVLKKHGFIGDFTRSGTEKIFRLELIYKDELPALTDLKRVSKPGRRIYAGKNDLAKLRHKLGHIIVSTPKGLRTHREAFAEKLGGEILCEVR